MKTTLSLNEQEKLASLPTYYLGVTDAIASWLESNPFCLVNNVTLLIQQPKLFTNHSIKPFTSSVRKA
ncbi:hypothetical protein [Legionella pneumophila]|uniref:hypothetical protein n=1 Tax=Legionella pneumophila TaxID=446 RepID=UPI000A7A2033|nr:hypothetical protein [Legionella pneumophila]MDW9139762.1 hypothetical protein [Legionella pneumophila]HAT8701571.1 hypothetical protein [Legionella pneumophila]HAT9215158.1 hypothetical protein [Legionella pneumophila subsp. pneumophila]HAT9261247.1 hypothetical protein [Legionella pneumophila subsp. pneumophila]HAT9283183.1 hypothetical protein [Legionella pneumophila subsp. pneumophila]